MNSQQKGKNYEREIAKRLNRAFGGNCRRTPQSGGLSIKGDIIDLHGTLSKFHFELKKQEKLNIWRAMAQAERDCPVGKSWVVIFSKNFDKDYVSMDMNTFEWLLGYMEEVDGENKKSI